MKFAMLFDETHEKLYANIVLMIAFSMLYYKAYKNSNHKALDVKNNSLNLFDFTWFSTLTQFGITFGDMIPKSVTFKLLVLIHVIMFWFIALV